MQLRSSRAGRQAGRRLLAIGLLALSVTASAGWAYEANQPRQGKLKIDGTHISRLVLQRDDNHTEEWTNLGGSIELPVGTYQVRQLSLRDNYTCQPQSLAKLGPIEIRADEPAALKAGGPLQQSIGVIRRGSMLVLSYRLHGIGGEEYGPQPAARAEFVVYRTDKAIGGGTFEYG